ncbi:RidA family protein [Nonomuraea sp. NPDC050643]|uniref:RidA family protein n=1 Tax=Nonomuraea sp. NPDC050643 TaxID=3155660 RepID=UPI0034079D77
MLKRTQRIQDTLRTLGLRWPDLAPTHEFVPVIRHADMIFVSGHAPYSDGDFRHRGRLGAELSIEDGRRAAQLAVLGCLASLEAELGDLGLVERILKMNGYVRCVAGFEELPRVTDGASRMLIDMFGDAGRHARTTVGVTALPAGVSVECELVVVVRQDGDPGLGAAGSRPPMDW